MVFLHPFSNSTVPHLFVTSISSQNPCGYKKRRKQEVEEEPTHPKLIGRTSEQQPATHIASPFHLGTQRGYVLLLLLSLFLKFCCIPRYICGPIDYNNPIILKSVRAGL